VTYRLTGRARDDLIRIYLVGVALFGVAQAEAYQDRIERTFRLLADNPGMALEDGKSTAGARASMRRAHHRRYGRRRWRRADRPHPPRPGGLDR
jgi:toxin ParE1/3/4